MQQLQTLGFSSTTIAGFGQLVADVRQDPATLLRPEKIDRLARLKCTADAAMLLQSSISDLAAQDSVMLASDLGGPEFGKRLSEDLLSLISATTAHEEELKRSGLLDVRQITAPARKAEVVAKILRLGRQDGLEFSTGEDSAFRTTCTIVFAAAGLKDMPKALAAASKARGLKGGRGPAAKTKSGEKSIPRKWVFDVPGT